MKPSTKDRRVELLFEVGCEEIPAGMLPKAEEELRANIEKLLAAENSSEGVSVFPHIAAAQENRGGGECVGRGCRCFPTALNGQAKR